MKIVSVEGADKSGKHTNSMLLANELKKLGYKVEHSEFPRYDTEIGKLIRGYLYGEFDGKFDHYTFELLQTADKQAQQLWFKELEDDGVDFLVLDRYVDSQLAYGKSVTCNYWENEELHKNYYLNSAMKEDAIREELAWQQVLTKYMRKPDIRIYLDVTPEVSMARKGQHGENDKYESNKELLSTLRDSYLNGNNDFIVIDANRPMEEVNKDIIALAKTF